MIDLKPFEVAVKTQRQWQKEGRGEEGEKRAGRRGGEGRGGMERQEGWREDGRGKRTGWAAGWKHGGRERERGMKGSEVRMDGWRDGRKGAVGMLVSLLAQHFPAHTTSTQLQTDLGGALS